MAIIRRAGVDDLETLVALRCEFNALDDHLWVDTAGAAALAPLLRDDLHGQVWLIADTDHAAAPAPTPASASGYAVVTWGYSLESGGRDALLDEIYVRERGVGIGGRALTEILAATAKAGASRMFLETESGNEPARRFYRRYGFVADSSIWMSRDLPQ